MFARNRNNNEVSGCARAVCGTGFLILSGTLGLITYHLAEATKTAMNHPTENEDALGKAIGLLSFLTAAAGFGAAVSLGTSVWSYAKSCQTIFSRHSHANPVDAERPYAALAEAKVLTV